ncbi:Ditrans,polycis-undecaprenyl-diphosphate synthase ((2E,6E)-farnesyl-diphosphate specific) [Streptomyces griseoloalbus]
MAVGYGSQREIVDAVKSAFEEHIAAGGDPAELVARFGIDDISRHLYSPVADHTDFIIRTSGEQRLSGFLLWQSAYAEMHWVDCYSQAFRHVDFLRALRSYAEPGTRFAALHALPGSGPPGVRARRPPVRPPGPAGRAGSG